MTSADLGELISPMIMTSIPGKFKEIFDELRFCLAASPFWSTAPAVMNKRNIFIESPLVSRMKLGCREYQHLLDDSFISTKKDVEDRAAQVQLDFR